MKQRFGHWTAPERPWKAMQMESPNPQGKQPLNRGLLRDSSRAHKPGGGGSEQNVIGAQSLAVSR